MTIPVSDIEGAMRRGELVPYLGPGILSDVSDRVTGEPMPTSSDELIIALNRGRPMAPKLMYEFPRAAMNVELKRGRSAVTRFFTQLYAERRWSQSAIHRWLREVAPPLLIDTNRDIQLQEAWSDSRHLLVAGVARIVSNGYRFRIYQFDGDRYSELDSSDQSSINWAQPILFKPMGSPLPEANYIASDADYVDYITELMGGFGVPAPIKQMRGNKRYLLLGMRFTRDTERMIFSDLTCVEGEDNGWALIAEPTAKERRFCARKGIEIVELEWEQLLMELQEAVHP